MNTNTDYTPLLLSIRRLLRITLAVVLVGIGLNLTPYGGVDGRIFVGILALCGGIGMFAGTAIDGIAASNSRVTASSETDKEKEVADNGRGSGRS